MRSSSLRNVLQHTSRGMECRSHLAESGASADSVAVSAHKGSEGGFADGSLRRGSFTDGAEPPLTASSPFAVVLGSAILEGNSRVCRGGRDAVTRA